MISWRAVCKSSALTWVNTLLIFALLCGWAVRVRKAFIRPAEVIRITDVIGFAGAKGPMTPGTADGINTTVLVQAGVLTFSIIACKSEVTLGITLAAS